jgi:hypothetical protein
MATTREDLSEWFDAGVEDKHTHMIVVCDTFDWDDYPVYATGDAECFKEYHAHNGPNMQKVMEVYDLRKSKASQLGGRVMNLPKV